MIKKIIKTLANPQGALVQTLLETLLDQVSKIFKMPQLLDYMELENSTDRGVKSLKNEVEMIKGEYKEMIKEFEEMKETIKKIKKLRVFKSIGK